MTRAIAIVLSGTVYHWVYTTLVGIAASVPAPRWFVPLLQEHQTLGLTLMSFVTTVPAAAISAAIVGFALSRFLTDRFVLGGFLSVCVMVFVTTMLTDYGRGVWNDLWQLLVPQHVSAVPMALALWVFLPVATDYFGRRKAVVSD